MHIADSFKDNGKVYAVCSGTGIKDGMSINKIQAVDRQYNVSAVHVVKSFIGIPQAIIEIAGTDVPPKGETSII